MKLKFFALILATFFAISCAAQPSNYYYYYQSQTVPIVLSDKVMFVKFTPGLTNTQKQDLIVQAEVDLQNGTMNNIPDIVKLKSRIVQKLVWVSPCAVEKSNTEVRQNVTERPLPCDTCPPDCTPYQVMYTYDNFYDALFFFLDNQNVISGSKAVVNNTDTVATCEDFYIKIKPGYSIADFSSLINTYSLTAIDVSNSFGAGVYKIQETRGGSRFCPERANLFYETGKCEYSTPNFYDFTKLRTNDPLWANQWNLLNTGQYGGTPNADIRVSNAWPISKGNNVRVAVIDEAIQLDHPDLQGNLVPGYDVTGFNSNGGLTSSCTDEIHGSSMAGIIAAVQDNGIDITGVAPLSKIMPVKAFHRDFGGYNPVNHADLARGFIWAYMNGADVLNCSWGLSFGSDIIRNAITEAGSLGRGGKGCVIVGAVGSNNSTQFGFPENHLSVIAVGALTTCNARKTPTTDCDPNGSPFWEWGSNYGDKLSVMAPGVRIPTITMTYFSYTANPSTGTSPAAAQVSAVAALILAVNPALTRSEVQKILEIGSNRVGNYCYNWTAAHPNGPWNNEMGYGRLNAYNAVQLARPGVTISNPVYDIPSQATTQVSNNLGIIFNGKACSTTLPTGVNFVRRFAITTDITFPATNNPYILCTGNGFNLANPNDGRRFAEAINVTNTSATLRTYAYYGYNSLGQELGWIPTSPANIKFTYCIVGGPTPILYENQRSVSNKDSLANISKIPFTLDFKDDIAINNIPVTYVSGALSPNPVKDFLTIKTPHFFHINKRIEIFNISGNAVFLLDSRNYRKGASDITINVSHLKSGVYLLKIGAVSYKFIKQ